MEHWKRNFTILAFALVLIVAASCRFYFECVPRGVEYIPFTGYSHELPPVVSPNGTRYRVYVNDAGGMHSGNYWTWVVGRNFLTGRYVVTEGYVTAEYSSGDSDLIVNWDKQIPVIEFEDGRY